MKIIVDCRRGMNLTVSMSIIVSILTVMLGGCARNHTDLNQTNVTPPIDSRGDSDYASCDEIVMGFENSDKAIWEDKSRLLVTRSGKDKESYTFISSCLLRNLVEPCTEDAMASHDLAIVSESDFNRIRNIGETLAEMRNAEAIPILIDCSNRTQRAGGRLSPENYPAVGSLLQFGDDAIPFLVRKYVDSDWAKKCRIGSILAMIRSPKAHRELKRLLGAEKNPNVRTCLTSSLRAS